MSLRTVLTQHLKDVVASWASALRTLPDSELLIDRDRLRQSASDGSAVDAVLLAAFEGELQRRHNWELPL